MCCRFLFIAASLALVACSPTTSGNKDAGKQSASATVSSSTGGTVKLDNGSGVSVPPGAVSGDVTVTATTAPDAPPPPEAAAIVGTPVTFGPEGQQFSVPVTVTLTFDPASIPAGKSAADLVVFTAPAGTTNYTKLAATLVDATHVSAQTTHFSTFVPGFADAAVDAGQPDAGIVVDAGPVETDGGVDVDAGPVETDAGFDGGPVETDAGVVVDAGSVEIDAGPVDAGNDTDAGPVDPDGGTLFCGVDFSCEPGSACIQGVCIPQVEPDAGTVDAGPVEPDAGTSTASDGGSSPTDLSCPALVECATGCTDSNCVGLCESQATPAAQSQFEALVACVDIACPRDGVCSTDSEDCAFCQQDAFHGACEGDYRACYSPAQPDGGTGTDGGNTDPCEHVICEDGLVCIQGRCFPGGGIDAGSPDAGGPDAGPPEFDCTGIIHCQASCAGNGECAEACYAQGSFPAQEAFAGLMACVNEGCPTSGVCAEPDSVDCRMCRDQATQTTCQTEFGACVGGAPDGGTSSDGGGSTDPCEHITCEAGFICIHGGCHPEGGIDAGPVTLDCEGILYCQSSCGANGECAAGCYAQGSPSAQMAFADLSACVSAQCSSETVCADPGSNDCRMCNDRAIHTSCQGAFATCTGAGSVDAGATSDGGGSSDPCEHITCEAGYICMHGGCYPEGGIDAGPVTLDCQGILYCQDRCGGNGACVAGCYGQGSPEAQGAFSELSACVTAQCSGETVCANAGSIECRMCRDDALHTTCQGAFAACSGGGSVDAGSGDSDGGTTTTLRTCGDVLACTQPCNDAACVEACRGNAYPSALPPFDSYAGCLDAACPSGEGEVCETFSEDCRVCQHGAQGGVCNELLNACTSNGGTPDGGSGMDGGTSTFACPQLVDCVDTCMDSECEQGCRTQATFEVNEVFDALVTCLDSACPVGDGQICMTNSEDCRMCRQNSTFTTCSGQNDACFHPMEPGCHTDAECAGGACVEGHCLPNGTDGGTSALSCNELMNCNQGCMDSECQDACYTAATPAARSAWEQLVQCVDEACPMGTVCQSDTEACRNCQHEASATTCAESYDACVHSSGTDGGTGENACANVPLTSGLIPPLSHPEAPPVFVGGDVADGRYDLVQVDLYDGQMRDGWVQQTVYFSAGQLAMVIAESNDPNPRQFVGSVHAMDSKLEFALTCPGPDSFVLNYTVVGEQLITSTPQNPFEVRTFQRASAAVDGGVGVP